MDGLASGGLKFGGGGLYSGISQYTRKSKIYNMWRCNLFVKVFGYSLQSTEQRITVARESM